MKFMNSKRCRRYLAVLAAGLFTCSVFAVTAFAVEDQMQEAQPADGTSSVVNTSSQPNSVPDSTQAPDGSSGENSGVDSSGSGAESSEISSEEPSSQSQPTESSKEPEESSGPRPSSSSKRPAVTIPAPETIASAPADSRNPTEFSSGDLEALLSSPDSKDPADISEGFLLENDEDQTGGGGEGGGGLSTLLLSGIALILAGVVGIGTFFYRQFLRKEPPKPAAEPDLTEPGSGGIYGDLFAQPAGAGDSKGYYDEAGDDYDQYAQYDKSGGAAPEYEEISSVAPEVPENAQTPAKEPGAGDFTDISSGRKHGVDSDGFDWDHFFQNNRQ